MIVYNYLQLLYSVHFKIGKCRSGDVSYNLLEQVSVTTVAFIPRIEDGA